MEILIGVEVARSCSLRGKAVMGRVMEREKEKALNLVARNSRTTTKWTRALSLMSFVRLSPCGNGQSRWQELKPCLAAPGRPVLYLYRLPSACHYLKIETETPRDRERKREGEKKIWGTCDVWTMPLSSILHRLSTEANLTGVCRSQHGCWICM